jgi:hypothetical protein
MELLIQTGILGIEEKRIKRGIKVRKNSIVSSPRNNRLRNKEVMLLHTNDLLKWKTKRKYGHRWIAAETVFSTIKRTFGEHVSANRFKTW